MEDYPEMEALKSVKEHKVHKEPPCDLNNVSLLLFPASHFPSSLFIESVVPL